MEKIKIGKRKFEARPIEDSWLNSISYGNRIWTKLNNLGVVLPMKWRCDDGKRIPEPYPTTFPNVSANFKVHAHLPRGTFGKDEIAKATNQANRDFLDFVGMADDTGLRPGIESQIGTVTPTFDVDADIAALKSEARLKIKVKLKYLHFRLHHVKAPRNGTYILSLPDEVLIYATKTHECTRLGLIEIPKRLRVKKLMSLRQVPANKGLDYELRSHMRKREAKEPKAELKRLEAELEGIKPVEKPEED